MVNFNIRKIQFVNKSMYAHILLGNLSIQVFLGNAIVQLSDCIILKLFNLKLQYVGFNHKSVSGLLLVVK